MEASAAAPDWLAACRRIAVRLRAMLAAHPTTVERAVEVGRGEGGDRTLVIDRDAEEEIFAELARLHEAGARFTAISEERGQVAFGGGPMRVVIDPIDGSMNAKRGLAPHAFSLAVADGPTMADVAFGYVYELVGGVEWEAVRGGGARRDGETLEPQAARERRSRDGRLELVAIEAAYPALWAHCGPQIARVVHRVRIRGSMADSLCLLAGGHLDGMATLGPCRSVDVAAAQLIVRESGGLVSFTRHADPLGAPLDLVGRSPLVAAHTKAALAELATLPSSET